MKAQVQIPKVIAIKLGIEPLGTHEVEIDLVSLSEESRALVADAYETSERAAPRLVDLSSQYRSTLELSSLPTVQNVLAALGEIEEVLREKAAAEQEKQERLPEEAREVLRERRTRPIREWQANHHRGHTYDAVAPDWPETGGRPSLIAEVVDSPEAVAWQQELSTHNQRERDRIDAMAEEEELAKERARHATEEIRDGWIREHGSERLRWLLDEGMELEAAYRDERLALERPGWQWSAKVAGEGRDPRNPPIEAKAILEEARKLEPGAELRWLVVTHEHDDCEDEDECPRYESTRYVAIAEFLGKEILFGGV